MLYLSNYTSFNLFIFATLNQIQVTHSQFKHKQNWLTLLHFYHNPQMSLVATAFSFVWRKMI